MPKPSKALAAPCGGVPSETGTSPPSYSRIVDLPTPMLPMSPRPAPPSCRPYCRCSRSRCLRSSTLNASYSAQASSSVSTIASTLRLVLLSSSLLPLELSGIQRTCCFFFLSMVFNSNSKKVLTTALSTQKRPIMNLVSLPLLAHRNTQS